jgi:hypothetical protein
MVLTSFNRNYPAGRVSAPTLTFTAFLPHPEQQPECIQIPVAYYGRASSLEGILCDVRHNDMQGG